MPSKQTVVKKKSKGSKLKALAKPGQRPSKFIGCGIFKYYDNYIHTDLVRGVKVERQERETDKELEQRAVKECYATLKAMTAEFKERARGMGFKTR